MLLIRKILYPTDFSPCASHALPHALDLAERHRAELHLLHAIVLHEGDPANAAHQLPNIEELYRTLEEQTEAQLRAISDEYSGGALEIKHALVRSISAAGATLDYAAESDIDLVVMGTHGRRGLKRLLLGSVAEEVVRLAPCPVLTVPERRDGRPVEQVTRIVVPVDFSEHANLAIAYAKELAVFYEADMHLVHVMDEIVYPDFYPAAMPSGESITEQLRGQSLERMNDLLAQISDPHVEAHTHVRSGRAAPAIAEFAQQQSADLIVIASHGLTGIRHMLLGSVTEQLIRRAPCPVFTAKAFGKKLLLPQTRKEPG
jgi:nucleotide-binding universal stress UspA family protein